VPVGFAEERVPGSCPSEYTLVRTWTAQDDCSNASEVDQVVTVQDTTPPVITLSPNGAQFICDGRPVTYQVSARDNCTAVTLTLLELISLTAHSQVQVTATPMPDGSVRITATGPAMVWADFVAEDACDNASAAGHFAMKALLGQEACSQGFWRNHPERWGPTGYSPSMSVLLAFGITDLSSPEIPGSFDPGMTLMEAANQTGGSFNQALLQGVAALLNAAYPDMDYPWTVAQVQAVMQDAFAGVITFAEATSFFNTGNAAERECGCPAQ
jgi:hypothetical protein